jgi:threonine 3-dehydrogenase
MSGNSDALNGMLAAMCHGGKIAVLGIQSKHAAIDWDLVVSTVSRSKGSTEEKCMKPGTR